MFTFAKLSASQLAALQEFEKRERLRVLALAEVQVTPAALDAERLGELQGLERDLGVCLVAVAG